MYKLFQIRYKKVTKNITKNIYAIGFQYTHFEITRQKQSRPRQPPHCLVVARSGIFVSVRAAIPLAELL